MTWQQYNKLEPISNRIARNNTKNLSEKVRQKEAEPTSGDEWQTFCSPILGVNSAKLAFIFEMGSVINDNIPQS